MPSLFLRHGLVGEVPSGGDISSFLQERGDIGVRVYQEDVLQGVVKQLNMTLFSGEEWVFQQDSVPVQKPRRLRSGCGGTFRPSSASRIGPRGVQTSTSGTINCGLFWRTWLAKGVTTTGQSEEIPLETVRVAIGERPEGLKACVEAEGGHF
jgi:hypothetical protein